MPRIPAPAIGLVFAIAAFAVLSSSPAVGLALAGAALVAIAFGVMAWSTDDQLAVGRRSTAEL